MSRGRRTALWVSALLLPLAGCFGGGEALADTLRPFHVGSDAMEEGRAYAFLHEGGALRFSLADGDSLAAVLFDPRDARLGLLELGEDALRREVRIEAGDTLAGEYVLFVQQRNGTILVESAGRLVTDLRALPSHFERHILVDRPVQGGPLDFVPSPLLGGGDPIDEEFPVRFERTPVALRLLAAGCATGAQVQVRGGSAPLLSYEGSYSTGCGGVFLSQPGLDLQSLAADVHPYNLRGTQATASVRAGHMEGALVLEAWGFSRTAPASRPAHAVPAAAPAFTYGEVPERPVAIVVHARAQALFVWSDPLDPGQQRDMEAEVGMDIGDAQEEAEAPAPPDGPVRWLVLFGPDDQRIGSYPVAPGIMLRIPVEEGGDHVAVAKGGRLFLGADRAPADFGMRILEVTEQTVPPQSVGQPSRYAQANDTLAVQGVPYAVQPTLAAGGSSGDPLAQFLPRACGGQGSVRVLWGQETLGYWGPAVGSDFLWLDLHVPAGAALVHDGFGASGGCDRAALLVKGYLR